MLMNMLLDPDLKTVMEWKKRATQVLEPFRATGHKSTDAILELSVCGYGLYRYCGELASIFKVSAVSICQVDTAADEGIVVLSAADVADMVQCRRCWNYHWDKGAHDNLCHRCVVVMLTTWPDHEETAAIRVSVDNHQYLARALTPYGLVQPFEDIMLNIEYFRRKHDAVRVGSPNGNFNVVIA